MEKVDVVQLCLRRQYEIAIPSLYIYNSDDAAKIFSNEIGARNIECVSLICLDSTYRLINYSMIATGKINNVNANTAEIFKTALLSNASMIFIAHNHPSGELQPTKSDILMTKNIGSIAKIFDIELIDSLIVGANGQVTSIRKANEMGALHEYDI